MTHSTGLLHRLNQDHEHGQKSLDPPSVVTINSVVITACLHCVLTIQGTGRQTGLPSLCLSPDNNCHHHQNTNDNDDYLPLLYLFAFYTVRGVLAATAGLFAIPSSSGPLLSELFTMICLSWVARHSVAQRVTEVHKPLCHDDAVILNIHWKD